MKTALFLTAFLTLSTTAHAGRHEVASFDDLMQLTRGHIVNMDGLQREAERPFVEVAPRCLNNWEKYEAEYHRVHRELKGHVEPLIDVLAGYLREVRDYRTDAYGLTLEAACGEEGAKMERDILSKREIVKRLVGYLAPVEKSVDTLHRAAFQTFIVDAQEKDFGRNLGCLFKNQYQDVALLAMFRDYYPRGERAPAPALYQIGVDLDRVPHWAHEEERSLTDSLVRLNSLRLSCRR